MASINAITGVETVLRNLKTRMMATAAGCQLGLKEAGLKLHRASVQKVPVDYGNLKASAFTRSEGTGFGTVVLVGYTASYAMFVHELVDMKLKGQPRPGGRGDYWDPQGKGQAKFLEEPARTMQEELRRTIADRMKIL